jgi:hypothetical protein
MERIKEEDEDEYDGESGSSKTTSERSEITN